MLIKKLKFPNWGSLDFKPHITKNRIPVTKQRKKILLSYHTDTDIV